LAIFLRTGTKEKNVSELAADLMAKYKSLSSISNQGITELASNKGIGIIKATELNVLFEAAKRIMINTNKVDKYTSIHDLYKNIVNQYAGYEREVISIISISKNNTILANRELFLGADDHASFCIRSTLKMLINTNANKFIMVHNHPDGNSDPSANDIFTTMRMKKAAKDIGIELIEHVVLGAKDYYLILENRKYFAQI
jgi:DNA repair protein RadC